MIWIVATLLVNVTLLALVLVMCSSYVVVKLVVMFIWMVNFCLVEVLVGSVNEGVGFVVIEWFLCTLLLKRRLVMVMVLSVGPSIEWLCLLGMGSYFWVRWNAVDGVGVLGMWLYVVFVC